jgi:hypothetical protein
MTRFLKLPVVALMLAVATPAAQADGMVEPAAAAQEKAEAFDLPTDVEVLLDTPTMLAGALRWLEYADKAGSNEYAANLRVQLAEKLGIEPATMTSDMVRIWLLLKLADAPAGQEQLLSVDEQAMFSNIFCHVALDLSTDDPEPVIELLADAQLPPCWGPDE